MPYHVIFSMPDACIYEGTSDDSNTTFESFEDARKAAIDDLEHCMDKMQVNLEELRSAKKWSDLSYHQ